MSLTNTQFDTVMRYYEEVRERNRYEQNCRTEEIYRKIPEIMSLDDQVAVRSRTDTAAAASTALLPICSMVLRLSVRYWRQSSSGAFLSDGILIQ